MKKLLLVLFLLIIGGYSWAAAPTRPNSYVSGTVIDPIAVTGNEVPLYTYLQSGVDTYAALSITNAAVSTTAGIVYSKLNLSGGIVPGDINTSVTTNIYQFGGLNVGTAVNGNILYNNGTSYVPITIGSQGQVLESSGTVPQWSNSPYVKVSEQQSSGVNGGSSTSGSWITRVLNTTDTDTASISSLGSNQITLPAGTYLVRASTPFFGATSTLQSRLQNITAGSTLLTGTSSNIVSNNTITSTIVGKITLAVSSALAIQYQVSVSEASNGLGGASGFGTEVYTVAEFTKIS